MYTLWIAKSNEHVAKTGYNKGKVVGNDAYKQVSQHTDFEKATYAMLKLIAENKANPDTKIKLIATVPPVIQAPADELAQLKARIAELEGTPKAA